jgi:CheY-like chemotaxis protein/nitrogen-specific signal transduction histidine kinase
MNKTLPSDDDPKQVIQELELEIKRLEKDLNKTREIASRSDKLKSAFLANMSHAIRTPMNAIIGFSELIGIESIKPDTKQSYIRIINEKGHQLLSLIDDLIEISKIESDELELNYTQINLDEFMNEVYSSIFRKKQKDGKDQVELIVEKHTQEEFGQIQSDPGRIQQILNNLLAFSIRNTNKGTIKFGYTIKDPKTIEFYVIDTGLGLNKEDQKIAFDYFWQFEDITHQHLADNGLALTIAKNLVELLGGKIWLNSELNQGNEFYFTLPIEKPGKASEIKLPEVIPAGEISKLEPNWKDKVILTVEDDAINYQFIEALLEKSQVQLLHAENGTQALELCKTINKIDLILMDIKLPEKNGYQITKEIKSFREIPIIALTAFSVNEVRNKCLSSGCEDVISKPVEIELLLNILNKYLADKP